jgi:ArsR family transcriptional regulator
MGEPAIDRPRDHGAPLDRSGAERIARTLRALADPTRLQVLSVIAQSPLGEVTVGALAESLELTQPTVTHHVRILVDDGVLVREQRGRQVWLSLALERRDDVNDLLR